MRIMGKNRMTAATLALCILCAFMAAGCGEKKDAGTADGTPERAARNAEGTDNNSGMTDVLKGNEFNAEAVGQSSLSEEGGGPGENGSGESMQGDAEEVTGKSGEETGGMNPDGLDASVGTLTLRIVDGAETGNLVLAGSGAGEVYTLSVADVDVLIDGALSNASVLEDGMLAEIRYTGGINESFPAQIGSGSVESVSVYSRGSKQNPLGEYYDLCGLYLQVLNDLWDVDSGLNDGAVYVSVDLSNAPGELTEGEKAAVAWIFACAHDAEMLTLTYTELAEQGYLTEYRESAEDGPKLYEWGDGVLFSIMETENGGDEFYSLPVLRFDAQKWRSPLGAYVYDDCKAVWAESGSWGSYSVGAEAIS